MVEGAEARGHAKPCPNPLTGTGAGGAAAVALLLDVVSALNAGEFVTLAGCEAGSKGGRSIALPPVGATWFKV